MNMKEIDILRSNESGRGFIGIFYEYKEGLDGIEEFSHIMLIA